MNTPRLIRIENREHLLSTLAEAAELEHNLMCLYLYAVFSFKQSCEEGLSEQELKAVQSWRKKILDVSVQEMCHLALVSNLIKAIGGSPHFYRSTFPITPGYFPAEFVIELAPFDQDTLTHFIFLERPETEDLSESPAFLPEETYARHSPRGRLMTHVGDYSTVGQLYRAIEKGLEFLSEELGEKSLFCGASALQLTPEDVELEGLSAITDKASALKAIAFIVEQGEGARSSKDSHFEKFTRIQNEYNELLKKNPAFQPARNAVRNPAMRKPVLSQDQRTWVTEPRAANVMDIGNAIYALMLRFLTQVYSVESRTKESKKTLLNAAFGLMHALGKAGSLLSQLPVSPEKAEISAGLSFALERHFNSLELTTETAILKERLENIISSTEELLSEQAFSEFVEPVKALRKALHDVHAKYI